MQPFATDVDLLHWEPNILVDAAAVAQTVVSGSADLDGETLTLTVPALTGENVGNGNVVALSGAVTGSFAIVSVVGADSLTLSVLYDGLDPDRDEPAPSPPGSAVGLGFAIRTFWPQRVAASERILALVGLTPADASKVLNPDSLRTACVLAALQMIYLALAAGSADSEHLLMRAALYERLFTRMLRIATLHLDHDGDGMADEKRSLRFIAMTRA